MRTYPFFRSILLGGLCLLMASCAHTSLDGYHDPRHVGYKPKVVMVSAHGFALGMTQDIENKVCDQLGEAVKCIPAHLAFPPTEDTPDEHKYQELLINGVDTVIGIAYGDEAYNRFFTGVSTTGRATTTYYPFTNTAYTTMTATSTPMFASIRRMASGMMVWRVDTRQKMYVGEMSTAGDEFSMSNRAFADSMARRVSKEVRARFLAP